jgi:hypothetical protein
MIVTEYDDPWKHIIIDDFLDRETFKWLVDYIKSDKNLFNPEEITSENHQPWYGAESEVYDKLLPFLIKVKDQYQDKLNYTNRHIPNVCYPHFQINFCNPNFRFPEIHQDNENKALTVVLYVYPNDSDGTEIYSSFDENSLAKRVEWKPNRALCFVSQRNPEFPQTWHNFGNTRKEVRVTINLTLEKEIDIRSQENY